RCQQTKPASYRPTPSFWWSISREMEPGCRFGITDIAKEKRVIFHGFHLRDGGDIWNRDDRLAFAVQAKAPNLRRPAEQIADINGVGGRFHELNDRVAWRNDHRRIREFRFIQGRPQNFPARRVRPRKQIKRAIATDPCRFNLVAELR